MSRHAKHQDHTNLLVELAFRWANIETEARVKTPALGRALKRATRIEAIFDEFDADSRLPAGDAQEIMRESGDYEWTPSNVDVVGSYVVNFEFPRDAEAAVLVKEDTMLPSLVERYTKGLSVFSKVIVGFEGGSGLRLRGQVCRRPADALSPRAAKTPKFKRGRHSLTPIEADFYDELKETDLVFGTQVTVEGPGKEYRPDFVVFFHGGAVAVELDGHEAHASRKQRQYDNARERWLDLQGIRTLRWTGSDVHRNSQACVSELVDLVRSFERHRNA